MRKIILISTFVSFIVISCVSNKNEPSLVIHEYAVVYLTAKNTMDRLTKKDDLKFDSLEQPVENYPTIIIDPNKQFQTIIGIGGAITDAAAETWAKYFNKKQEDLLGVGVFGDPGLAQAVQKDVTGIGYNNLAYLYDLKTRKQVAGVRALPIDVNGNGKIDADENFYDTIDHLTKAIATDKYPSPPARNLGFLFKGKPAKPELIAFVKYVLTDGQKFIEENGYIALSKPKIKEELKKVN